jgi:hypothetical protein
MGWAYVPATLAADWERMEPPVVNAVSVWFLACASLVVMLALLEVGRRIGIHRRALDPEGASPGLGAIGGRCLASWGC